MTISAPICPEPYHIPLAIECRQEQKLCEKLMIGVTLNPLAAAHISGSVPVCETVCSIDTLFRIRLAQYRDTLTLARKKDDIVIQRLHSQAFANRINQVIHNFLGEGWFAKFLCWFPTRMNEATSRESDKAPNRLRWIIETAILEKQRLSDSLNLIMARINVIATEVFVNELLDSGNLPDDQKNEYIHLRQVHDTMFPALPSLMIRYKNLYSGMGHQLITDKSTGWKERLELLRDLFQLIELTNADLELNKQSVEEIIEQD